MEENNSKTTIYAKNVLTNKVVEVGPVRNIEISKESNNDEIGINCNEEFTGSFTIEDKGFVDGLFNLFFGKKISSKRFKKLLMSVGLQRNDAELLVNIKRARNKNKSFRMIEFETILEYLNSKEFEEDFINYIKIKEGKICQI